MRWLRRIFLTLLVLSALVIGGGSAWVWWQMSRPEVDISFVQLLDFMAPGILEALPFLEPVGIHEEAELAHLSLPPGYRIGLYASDLGPVRILRFTGKGDLLASVPRRGQVLLIERNPNNPRRGGRVRVLLDGLNRPHGLELLDDWLYVGEQDAIARVRFDQDRGRVQGRVERVLTGLPGGGNHWTKTLRLGPDGWLYFHVGSTCNVCIEADERRATLMRMTPDGTTEEIYATGLRNTVGWDWHPETGDLYGVDNGRDWLGDDYPPCELNRIARGNFYGWPFFNGANEPDPDFGRHPKKPAQAPVEPTHDFPPHSAPLAIHFLQRPFPPGLDRAALVTLHGSWNRSEKSGYSVVSLHWNRDGSVTSRPFATGFVRGDRVLGRPMDLVRGPDGALYLSDDYGKMIYRIDWSDANL